MHPMPKILRQLMALSTGLALSGQAFSHGYISAPESRNLLCRSGGNSACGAIQWEPQSLEAPSGWPERGPLDGQIASAGLAQFSPLDEQTASRWSKRSVSGGPISFSWTFTANHVSKGWRYYITKPGWNPNLRLSRASFEAQPFCQADGGMRQPPKLLTHQCQLPARTGYQLVLGVWEVGDTPNSFYNLVDLMFADGGNPPATTSWAQRGSIYPSVDLQPGDKVATRVFDAKGERPDLQTRLSIASAMDGQRNTWPYLLASRLNAQQTLLRAGQLAADGVISPVQGQNEVFARQDSGLNRVEVQIEKAATPPGVDLLVNGLAAQQTIVGGQLTLQFSVTAVGELELNASVFDHGGRTLGLATASLNNTGQTLRIAIDKPAAGHHQLVLKGVVKGSGLLIQKTFDLMFVAEPAPGGSYQYRFPEGLKAYKAGTRVLQPRNGRIYECRPWPNNGFCVQWSPSTTQFEPGIGSHWQEAWIAR